MVQGNQRNWEIPLDDWSGKYLEWSKFELDSISFSRKLTKKRSKRKKWSRIITKKYIDQRFVGKKSKFNGTNLVKTK